MRIALGTTSTDKLSCLQQTLHQGGLYWDVNPLQVNPAIPEQPLSLEQTTQGATNRAVAALAADPDADAGIGMEGGLEKIGHIYNLVCVVAVWDGQKMLISHSNFLPLPEAVSRDVERGGQFGQLIRNYQLTARKDELDRIQQLISRQSYFEQAIKKLIPQLKQLHPLDLKSKSKTAVNSAYLQLYGWLAVVLLYTMYFVSIVVSQAYQAYPNAQVALRILPVLLIIAQPILIVSLSVTAHTTKAGSNWPLKPAYVFAALACLIYVLQLPDLLMSLQSSTDPSSPRWFQPLVELSLYWLYLIMGLVLAYLLRHLVKVGLMSWLVATCFSLGWIYAQVNLLTVGHFYNPLSQLVQLTLLVGLTLPLAAYKIYVAIKNHHNL